MPLGGSRGPGSASGGLWGACGCKIRCAQNRIIRSNLKNTVKYVKYDTTYNTPTPYDPSLLPIN